jgi:RNA polymerase sigma factor (sigma-70 family)
MTGQINEVLGNERSLSRETHGATDAQLLESFIARQDEGSFETLVRRHGPMVWTVCRRVLGHVQDAEDAFQATFLVLVRKAASVKPRSMVGNWLHGVAYRTAIKARAASTRRRLREKQAEVPEAQVAPQESSHEAMALLDQELGHLPDNYRAAVVLCDLEGKTHKQAARELGCPRGNAIDQAGSRKGIAGEAARPPGLGGIRCGAGCVAAAKSSVGGNIDSPWRRPPCRQGSESSRRACLWRAP